ncbi:MAG: zinc ABC transporter substrate-binding protein [Pseudomonadota bacterium]
MFSSKLIRARRLLTSTAVGAAVVSLSAASAFADDANVVSTIKPIHSLVSAVAGDFADVGLIVDNVVSPHDFSLRPSDAQAVQDADLVFWVGPQIEEFLDRTVDNLADASSVVTLIETAGLETFEYRETELKIEEGHDDHGHDDHGHDHAAEKVDDHGHDHAAKATKVDDHGHDHGHGHDEHAAKEVDDHGHDDHGHGHDHAGSVDGHIWLDPQNASVMVDAIAAALSEKMPDHASDFVANAASTKERLAALETSIATSLEGASDSRFIVFHDAYQYFERRFGLEAIGSINPGSGEVAAGARRIAELREAVTDNSISCVFSEPQYDPAIVTTVVEGTSAVALTIDPLGSGIEPGADHYFETLEAVAAAFAQCGATTG